MGLLDSINALGEWILSNFDKVLFSVVAIIVGYVLYKVVSKEVMRLKNQKRLEEHLAYTLNRVAKWVVVLIVLSAILAVFGVTFGVISGLLTLLGGTIIGFAAINTIGNAIAGLIVMTSRPFKVGDRISFNGQFADIVAIELIYTKMLTLDNVLVSVPNQELLKAETDNFGKKRVIRRHVTVTPGFEYDNRNVEKALLEAAGKVAGVFLPKVSCLLSQSNRKRFYAQQTPQAFGHVNFGKSSRAINSDTSLFVIDETEFCLVVLDP